MRRPAEWRATEQPKGFDPIPCDSHEEKHPPHPLHHRGVQCHSPHSSMVGSNSVERAFFRDALQLVVR